MAESPCYLDTQAAVWLAQRDFRRFGAQARKAIDDAGELLISPIVFLEMEYLQEIGRVLMRAEEIQLILHADHAVRICGLEWIRVTRAAVHEKWTRDPFDRLIVAHAKANGHAPLVSSDRMIRKNYAQAVW